jgi:tetratricopeptide (TPR) repeat protein
MKRAAAVLALLALVGLIFVGVAAFFWSDYHLSAARREIGRGHNAAGFAHLQSCRMVRSDHPEVLLLNARVARRRGAWTESEDLLDRYWRQRGDDDALVLERLLLRASRGEVEAVRPLLEARTAQNDPGAALAREALIAGLMYRFQLDDAERQIERWLDNDPDSTLALLLQGKLFQQRQQTSGALDSYRRVLEFDPEYDEARMLLTTALLEVSQGEEALGHAEYLRYRLPGNPNVLVQQAQALMLLNRGDEARPILDECLRDNPNHAAALSTRGRLARRAGDNEQAEHDLGLAVRLDPGDTAARDQYAQVLHNNGKTEEAAQQREEYRRMLADIQRIHELVNGRLRERPNDAQAHFEAAMIAMRAGQFRTGHRWLLRTLEIDPNHLEAHRALAAFYRDTGNPILAARHRAIARAHPDAGRPSSQVSADKSERKKQ